MKRTLLATLASTALVLSGSAAFADHAPQNSAPSTPYFSTQHASSAIKAVGLKPSEHRAYATDIVVLNFTSSTYEVEVDHPPVIDDMVSPNGYDRITNTRWYGMTDLHIYYYGIKMFDDLVGNHAIVAIYPDGIDVDNNSF